MHSNGEKSPQSTPVTVPKKKRGFCECCRETFEELQKVKAPLGPASLQKLQRPLSGLDDHNVPVINTNPFWKAGRFVQPLWMW